jgi:glycosyltransferase involved in cell wall biosynthesis
MRVLHVNTYTNGGAANACIALHLGLLEQGVDSHLLTLQPIARSLPQHTIFPVKELVWYQKIQKRLTNLTKQKENQRIQEFCSIVNQEADYFSFIDTPYDITQLEIYRQANIINLHWVGDFLDWPSFFVNGNDKRIVWTLHDMSPFTGGYHYANGYTGYQHKDQNYPPAATTKFPELAADLLKKKKEILKAYARPLQIVSPSRWLSETSASSTLFHHYPHTTIANSIDPAIFKPIDQAVCRKILNLPLKGTFLLSVSHDVNKPRKGFKILLDSLAHLSSEKKVTLCAVGSGDEENDQSFNYLTLGELRDPRLMAIAYNAADAFVISSTEDNLPNTMLEAIMCGTPVIGFSIGGIKDAIINGLNGYLSEEVNSEGLAKAIATFIAHPESFNPKVIRQDALERYAPQVQATSYLALYNKLFSNDKITH